METVDVMPKKLSGDAGTPKNAAKTGGVSPLLIWGRWSHAWQATNAYPAKQTHHPRGRIGRLPE